MLTEETQKKSLEKVGLTVEDASLQTGHADQSLPPTTRQREGLDLVSVVVRAECYEKSQYSDQAKPSMGGIVDELCRNTTYDIRRGKAKKDVKVYPRTQTLAVLRRFDKLRQLLLHCSSELYDAKGKCASKVSM